MAFLLAGGKSGSSSGEPVANLLSQFGLPVSDHTVKLAEAFADYAWASDTKGGKEAAEYLAGMRILGLLFSQLSGGEDDVHKLKLIYLLRVETMKSITDYVNSHARTPKAELENEVQRRLAVFAQQVLLIDEGIIKWKGGADGGGAGELNLPKGGPGPAVPPAAGGGGGRHAPASGRGTQRTAPASKPAASKPVEKSKPEKSGGGLFDGIFGSKSSSDTTDSSRSKQQAAPKAKTQQPPRDSSAGSRSSSRASRQEPAPAPKAADPKPARQVAATPKAVPAPEPAAPPPKPEPVHVTVPVRGVHPTVLPSSSFDVAADVEALRKAMKGMGCDDKAIINVLAYRSNDQRQEICKRFKAAHGKDLPNELEGELRGSMEDVALALVKTAYEYDAYLLRKAMKGLGTDEAVLIEIMASRSSSHLEGVQQCFQQMYGKDLLKEMKSETSGDFKALLAARLTVKRSDDGKIDLTAAREDAQALYAAGEGKRGTNEAKFVQVFSTRSSAHLRATFDEYDKMSKKTMEQAIDSETSGDFCSLLTAIAKCARDTQAYFAELLYTSMKGMGTNDDLLIRCVVSRCEVDMVEIKQSYQQTYGKTLKADIEGDCSGNYKRFLLALIDE
ncbi:annexin A4-like [Sycon ciliatum]|uniref:annexin A4-like n=1 Tax=Sycon ciliatum TaxID=27933 RepID=UPI0031F60BE4